MWDLTCHAEFFCFWGVVWFCAEGGGGDYSLASRYTAFWYAVSRSMPLGLMSPRPVVSWPMSLGLTAPRPATSRLCRLVLRLPALPLPVLCLSVLRLHVLPLPGLRLSDLRLHALTLPVLRLSVLRLHALPLPVLRLPVLRLQQNCQRICCAAIWRALDIPIKIQYPKARFLGLTGEKFRREMGVPQVVIDWIPAVDDCDLLQGDALLVPELSD